MAKKVFHIFGLPIRAILFEMALYLIHYKLKKYQQIAIASFIKYAFGMNTTVIGGSTARYRERITSQLSGVKRFDIPNSGIQIGAVLPIWTSEYPTPISRRSSHT